MYLHREKTPPLRVSPSPNRYLYDLTQLSSEGVPFEGTLIDDWKFDFSVHDARWLVCTNQVDMTGRLFPGSLAFESRILHYLIVRILIPRFSSLA